MCISEYKITCAVFQRPRVYKTGQSLIVVLELIQIHHIYTFELTYTLHMQTLLQTEAVIYLLFKG